MARQLSYSSELFYFGELAIYRKKKYIIDFTESSSVRLINEDKFSQLINNIWASF